MGGFSLLSVAFYAYFGVGSVALGYLLLRLTMPEVRTMDFNQRLGTSAISGLLLSAAAFAIDYSYDSADVMTRSGFFPLVLFLLLAASFAVLKIYFVLNQSAFLTIGIPMAAPLPTGVAPRVQSPPARPANKIPQTPLQAQPAAHPAQPLPATAIRPLEPAALPVSPQKPLTAPPQEFTPIELDFEKFGRNAPQPRPAQPPAPKPAAPPAAPAIPQAQTPAKPAQAAPVHAPKAPLAAAATKPAALSQPAIGTQPAAPQQASAQAQLPEEKKRIIMKLRREETVKPPAQKAPASGGLFGWLFPAPKPAPKPAEKKAAIPTSILKPPQKEPAWARPAQAKPAQAPPGPMPAPQKPVVEVPSSPPKGFLQSIDQVVSEKKAERASEVPRKEPLVEMPVVETFKAPTPEPETRRGFVTYRGRVSVGAGEPPKPRPPPSPEDAEAEEIAAELAPSFSAPQGQAPKKAVVRRRYMVLTEEGPQKDVSVIAEKQAAEKKEFDSLVTDVYAQLKDNQKPAGLRSTLSVNVPPAQAKKPQEKKPADKKAGEEKRPEITFDDLVGGGAKQASVQAGGAQPADVSSVFAKLRGMAGGEKPEQSSKIEFVKVEAEKGMGCPTCHSKSSRIIFCPYCGTGMCANCSPKIRPLPDQISYACPKCGEETFVKKRA